ARSAIRRRDGGMAIPVAILLTVLVGFAALATEAVAMLLGQRQLQTAADSAALSAAMAIYRGYPPDYSSEVAAVAAAAGYVDGQQGVSISINKPPLSGNYAGKDGVIEVVINQLQTLALIPLFTTASFTLTGRSVAKLGGTGSCALALDPLAKNSVNISNGGTVTLNGCGLISNSSSNSAVLVTGSATLNASALTTVGSYSVTRGGNLNVSGSITTGAPATADPYAGRTIPTPGTCLSGGSISNKTIALPAGTYCGGISLTNTSKVTLNGLYVLSDGDLSVAGGSTLSGTATIVLTGSGTGSKIGSVTISNGSIVNLTAPTSGATAGLVFFQDPRAPSSGVDSFIGGSANTVSGAMYFPN